MGIPKFYRWLSERYPLLNMSVAATEAPPEIDNLYLDMNGIIHNCTHANDPNLKLTETEMVVRIFTYLDKLIQIIKPQKLVFMAIDGVAPRAKMNQQRARRFKSAKEREAREAEMRAKGEEIDPATAFDSNCITPGTPFMDRLGRHLRFFIRRKMAEDPVWQKPNVIFSGHEVPGEGEHKIMEYIRWQKLQPGYPPNQRHCMYGLDADLIMLSLVTHEPHFCLLREVVQFSGRGRGQPSRETLENPCAENFILFQIGLLREYFEVEFGLLPPLPWSPDGAVDLERIVDDFVLFCMLVGNDFLPALPTMDIAEGGLNKLIQIYKDMLPELGGYLTDAGDLHHGRLEVMLGKLADLEMEVLQERAEDTEWFENKRARRGGGGRGGNGGDGDGTGGSLGGGGPAVALAALGVSLLDPLTGVALEEEEDEEAKPQEPTMMSKEARAMFLAGEGDAALDAWKARYYRDKLEMPDDQRRAVSEQYICGLHWVLQYYYRGVASWDWFYPYHYAPMASELRDLGGIQVSFTPGKPFLPYEQLLAVQPPASCTLLPEAYHYLMTSDTSPIRDFYPVKFEIDMEGKRAEWEGVVKIPFISETRLLEAARSVRPEQLTADERRRNSHGDVLIFQHTPGRHEAEHCESTLPRWGATVHHAHSSCRHVPPPPPLPPAQLGFRPALVKGTGVGKKSPPGFPTLKTMKLLGAELKNAGVNVFGSTSKKESLILQLPDIRSALGDAADASAVAAMIGERVYVKWPYLQEAQITKVSDARQEITAAGARPAEKHEADAWSTLSAQTRNLFLTKQGVETGALPVMLHVKACTGYLRHPDGSVVKHYKTEEAPYPLQAVLRQRPRPPPGFHDPDEPRALDFEEGARVLFLGQDHYGCAGTVMADPGRGLGADGKRLAGGAARACVRVQPPRHDAAAAAKRGRQVVKDYPIQYFPSGTAARTLRINPRLLGRITGNVWIGDGENRLDIGLAVKNAKQGVCVPGLAAPLPDESGWSYSQALLDTVGEYRRRFPWVFTALEGTGEGRLTVESFVPPSVGATPRERSAKIGEVTSWLKGLPSAKRPLVKSGTQVASDRAVEILLSTMPPALPRCAGAPLPIDYENVAPPLLLGPYDPSRPLSTLLGGDMELGDRVVVVRGSGSPPFGARGTVVAVYEDAVELLMDGEFAGGTTLNGRIRLPRGATLPKDQLLNVSRPQRVHLPSKQDLPRRMREPAAAPGAAAAAAAAAADASDDPDAGRPTALAVLAPWCKARMPTRPQPRAIAPAPAPEPEPEPEAPPPAASAAAGGAGTPAAAQPAGGAPRGGAQQAAQPPLQHPKQQRAQPAVQVPAPQLNWQQQLLQGGRGARPGQPAAPGAAPQPMPAAPQQRQQQHQGRGRGAGPGIAVPLSVSPAQPPPPGSQLLRMLQQRGGAPGQPAPPPQPRPQHPQYGQGYGQPYGGGGAPPPPPQQPRQQLPYQNYEQQQPVPQQQLTWQQQQYYSHPGSQPVPPPPPPPPGGQQAGRAGGPGQPRQAGPQGQALLSMLQTGAPAAEGGKDKKKKPKESKAKEAPAPSSSAAGPPAGGSTAAAAEGGAKKDKKKKKGAKEDAAAAGAPAAAAAPAEGKKAKEKAKKQGSKGGSAEHLTAALTCTEGGGVKLSLSVDPAPGAGAAVAGAASGSGGAAAAAPPAAASAKKRERPGKKERAGAAAVASEHPPAAAEAGTSEAGAAHPVHLKLDVGTNGSVHAALSTDGAAAAAAAGPSGSEAPAEAAAPEAPAAAPAAAAAEPASPAKGGLLQRMTGFFSLGSKKKKEEKKDEKKGRKEEEAKKPEAKAAAAAATPFAAAAAEPAAAAPAAAPAADAAAPVEAAPQRSLSLKLMGGEGAAAAAPAAPPAAAAKKAPEPQPAADAAPAAAAPTAPASATGSVSPAPPASPLSASGRFSGGGGARGGGRPVTPPKGKAVPKMPDGTKGFTLGRGRAAGGAASPAAPGSTGGGGGAPAGSPFSAAPAPAASGSGGSGAGNRGGGGAILDLLKAASLKKPDPQPAPAAAPNAGALLLSQLQGQLAAGAAQQQPGAAAAQQQQQGALSGLLLGGAPMQQQPYGAAAQQQQMLLSQQQAAAAAAAGGGGVLPALLLGGAPMQPAAPPPNPLQQLLSNAAANPGQPAAASGAQLLMALQRGNGGSAGAPDAYQRPPTF